MIPVQDHRSSQTPQAILQRRIMTMNDLAERIEQLRKAATPGPWTLGAWGEIYATGSVDTYGGPVQCLVAATYETVDMDGEGRTFTLAGNRADNAALITELVNNLPAILTALRSADKSEWQPIQTAPKDGRPVILGVAGNEFYPRSGWWDEIFEHWVVRVSMDGESATGLGIDPTHWMPLPLPPVQEDAR